MTDPLEITPSCGCVYCDLEVEHASEDCGLIRGLNGVGIPREQAMAEIRSVIDAARLRRALDEGRDSGSDGQPTEEHIAEIRVLLEERRRGTFLSADEFSRRVVAMLQRKRTRTRSHGRPVLAGGETLVVCLPRP